MKTKLLLMLVVLSSVLALAQQPYRVQADGTVVLTKPICWESAANAGQDVCLARAAYSTSILTLQRGGGPVYPPEAWAQRIHRALRAVGSGTVTNSNLGDSGTWTDASVVVVNATSTAPVQNGFLTSTVSGNAAGWNGNQQNVPGHNLWTSIYGAFTSLSTARYFVGLSSAGVTTQLASDAPSISYAGFLFTTDGATVNGVTFDSTHLYVIANNASGSPTIVQTSVVADTSGHKYDVREDSAAGVWYFFYDGKQVATVTTTLPTAGLSQDAGVATLTTAAAQINVGWLETWSD